jgi:hypothetical protein
MSVDELQKKLIEKINSTKDIALLEELCSFMNTDEEVGHFYKLSDEQLSTLEDARIEIKNGKGISDEELNKETDQWLGK